MLPQELFPKSIHYGQHSKRVILGRNLARYSKTRLVTYLSCPLRLQRCRRRPVRQREDDTMTQKQCGHHDIPNQDMFVYFRGIRATAIGLKVS